MLECGFEGGCDLRTPGYSAMQDGFQMLVSPKVKGYEIISGKPDLNGLPHTYIENESEADTIKFIIEDESGIRINLFYTSEIISRVRTLVQTQGLFVCLRESIRKDLSGH